MRFFYNGQGKRAICKSRNGESGDGMRGKRGMGGENAVNWEWECNEYWRMCGECWAWVRMRGIRVGMQRIGVGMQESRVGRREI